MKEFILLLLFCHNASPVRHHLKYLFIGSSGVPVLPEFMAVEMVNEIHTAYYDSNTQIVVSRQDWLENVTAEYQNYLNLLTQRALQYQHRFKAMMHNFKQSLNQTGGVHTIQRMYGCEWDNETGETDGYNQFGYDGEDFISLDLKTLTWIAAKQQAVTTKMEWDADRAYNAYLNNFFTIECIDFLKKHLTRGGKSVLQRTERPTVSLLQKSPSSPVSCHATGFYPDSIMVMWRKDGEKLQDYGELLPNHDGTFQKAVDVDLAGVQPGDWGKYECVVQQRGVDDIITTLDQSAIRTNWGKKRSDPGETSDFITPVIVAVAVLVAMAAAVGVFMLYKKKREAECPQPAPQNSPEKEALRTLNSES